MPTPMHKVVIFRAHRPDKIDLAKYFISNGRIVILHTNEPNEEVTKLSQHPLIQIRLGNPAQLIQRAGLIAF